MQATQFANYHVTDPSVFYQKQDFWADPRRPDRGDSTDGQTSVADAPPYYLLIRLPGRTDERSSSSCRSCRQAGRTWWPGWPPNSDPGPDYGQMLRVPFPDGREHRRARRRCSRGSTRTRRSPRNGRCSARAARACMFGDFLVIPIDELVPVRPAGVRPGEPGGGRSRAEAGHGGERRRARSRSGTTSTAALRAAVTGLPSTGGGTAATRRRGSVSQTDPAAARRRRSTTSRTRRRRCGPATSRPTSASSTRRAGLVNQANDTGGAEPRRTDADVAERVALARAPRLRLELVGQPERRSAEHVGHVHLRLLQAPE